MKEPGEFRASYAEALRELDRRFDEVIANPNFDKLTPEERLNAIHTIPSMRYPSNLIEIGQEGRDEALLAAEQLISELEKKVGIKN